jgi:hypothetical protein
MPVPSVSRAGAVVAIALAAATATCLLAAAPASADTGSVYFDDFSNAAAGETLFSGSLARRSNVGLGPPGRSSPPMAAAIPNI